MTGEHYEVDLSGDILRFEFNSVGPKGLIRKVVDYTALPNHPGIYNLAFGDLQSDGSMDDTVVSDNDDLEKVLATVAQTAVYFLRSNPNKGVFFTGNTNTRTRLYRIAIARSLIILTNEFVVLGIKNGTPERFVVGETYEAFLIFND